jgi:transcriptional regulator with XRE-family HTH domain
MLRAIHPDSRIDGGDHMPSSLREWRERQGWTLAEVSGLTGVSVSHLSLIERGQREAPPRLRVLIARGIGATVSDLFPLAETEDAEHDPADF